MGQNLRDHPSACVLFRAAGDRPDVQAAAIQVGLRYTVEGSHLRNDMQISPLLMTSEHRPAQVVIDDDENYIGISAGLQLALGHGELRLKSSDPAEYPYLDYNYYQEPFDLERMRKAIRTCVEIGTHVAYRDVLLDRVNPLDSDLVDDAALDDWLMRNSGTSHHVSGTCKMGLASDGMAVVDQHGKVHGLENIRVADASIMPDCIRANTNATTIMIGEKIADYVRSGR